MLQTERIDDNEEALRVALEGFAFGLWTAMVGIVSQVNANGTVSVEPAIQANVSDSKGVVTQQNIALLVDVPVVYMGGGNMVATFPIAIGDEALVVFASRCIDAWFQSGGVQPQAEPRHHSMSDSFALVGPRSLARKLANVSTTTAQFRTVDGATYVEVAGSNIVNIVASGGVNITGPLNVNGAVSITGNAAITGDITGTGKVTAQGEVTGNNIPLSQHLHTGVQSGGSNTGTPIP
jgi:hypothetical protein